MAGITPANSDRLAGGAFLTFIAVSIGGQAVPAALLVGVVGIGATLHGGRSRVAGYLGGSPEFDQAVVDWAFAYAQQVALDYAAFTSGQPSASTRRTARKA